MIKAKKSLGQNFLTDKNILEKIVNVTQIQNKNILEIGPGTGDLTSFILNKNPKIFFAIEKDKDLTNLLNDKFKYKLKIINEDILDIDETNLFNENLTVFGNLPYNISTEILSKWIMNLKDKFWFDCLVLMFQKEVADRIVANHNNKKYGRLSVLVQSRCDVKKILDAPASIFSPKPKVDGAVIQLKPINNYCNVSFNNLETLLERSFSSRRKKIKNTLSKHKQLLTELGIDENLRPENLSVSNYCKLAKLID